MSQHVEVVYENGILRPVQPLPARFHEHQRLVISIEDNNAGFDWLAGADPTVSLETVREVLAKVPTPLAQIIHQEREER